MKTKQIDLLNNLMMCNIIPKFYLDVFAIVFSVTFFLYLYHSCNFLWGNHDWIMILQGTWNEWGMWNGRYFQTVMQQLMGGRHLPFLSNMFGIAGCTIAAILLANYWILPKSRKAYVFFSLFLTSSPFLLCWFYYVKDTIPNLWALVFVISALHCLEKQTVKYDLFAIFLILISLGSYAPTLNTLGVVFLSKIFLDLSIGQNSLKAQFKQILRKVLVIFVSLVLFKLTLMLLKNTGLMLDLYNNQMESLSGMIEKVPVLLKASFLQFFHSYPFIDTGYLAFVSLIFVLGLINFILYKGHTNSQQTISMKLWRVFVLAILIFCIFASTKISALLSSYSATYYLTIDSFAIPFVYLLFLAYLIRSEFLTLRNLTILVLLVSIILGIYRVLSAQKVWKLGFDAEVRLMERVIDRIESDADFDVNKKYDLFFVGNTPSLRPYYYGKKDYKYPQAALLQFSYIRAWEPKQVMRILAPTLKIKRAYVYRGRSDNPKPFLMLGIHGYLKDKKPFPHMTSVDVIDDKIIVIWSKNVLKDLNAREGL